MNRARMLVASAAIALIAGMGIAVAQQEPPRSAPAEKIAPSGAQHPSGTQQHQNGGAPNARGEGSSGRAGEAPQSRGRSETTGQAPRASEQNKSEHQSKSEQNRTTGQAPRASEQNKSEHQNKSEQNRTTGQAPRASEQNKSEQNRTTGQAPRASEQNKSEQNRTTGQAPRASEQNKSEQNRATTEGNEQNRATTGQGAAGTRSDTNVNITSEQRTQIHVVIVNERSAPRVSSVNFNLSVGTRVPRDVRIATLPARIVTIEPRWRGYEYFMVGEQIVIVNPRTMEIVAVVEA